MYFTIENPDVKMLEEFQKNKEYVNSANKEKEMFLFDITNKIRKPLVDVTEACNKLSNMTDDSNIKKGIYYIDYNSKKVLNVVNNVLDVSNMGINNIKIYETKYNPKVILEELCRITKKSIDNDVKFRTNISKTIPESLYGDSIRIKQVIKILLDNAVTHTENGYIDLTVNEVVKNDIIRMILTIEDTGTGIKTEDIKKLYNKDNQKYTNLNKIDDNKKNLAMAKSITTLLGGVLMLKSEVGSGSRFTFILDQKIVTSSKTKELKKIEKLTEEYTSKVKVLLVSEDSEYLEKTKRKLSRYDIKIESVNLGAKCLERVRNKEKYDYILIDESIEKLTPQEMMIRLKEVSVLKTPVGILTYDIDNKEYIKLGYSYLLDKDISKTEIEELIK